MDETINFFKFSVFINENELGKINFPLGKIEFWTHCGNSVHATEYLAFGKALLARLYQK